MRLQFTLLMAALTATALVGCPEPEPTVDILRDITVRIEPEDPSTGDDLVAVVEDPLNPQETYVYEWRFDGREEFGVTGDTVESARTIRSQEWQVTVWPASDTSGPGFTDTVSIANSVPSIRVTLDPEEPLAGEDLIADFSAEDEDSDSLDTDYLWLLDGVEMPNLGGLTVPGGMTERDQEWTFRVTANDGVDEVVEEVSRRIGNHKPVVTEISLVNPDFYNGLAIEAQAVGTDADNDELSFTYSWFINDELVANESSAMLDGSYYRRDDIVRVAAVASDGFADSEPLSSVEYVTGNAVPKIRAVNIEPGTGVVHGTDLTCVAADAVDVDLDPITFDYQWRNGVEVLGSDRTLPGNVIHHEDEITCTVTPSDDRDTGLPVTSSVLFIENTPPTWTEDPSLTDTTIYTDDEVRVSPGKAVDVDRERVTYQYGWTVNGTAVGRSVPGLDGTHFKKHDTVVVTVTPTDGTDDASPKSLSVTVLNSPPSGRIRVTPVSPSASNNLLCDTSIIRDVDGDTIRWRFRWYRNGVRYTSMTPGVSQTLTAYHTRSRQTWYCEAVADDGDDVVTFTSSSVTIR